jgi:hypothetical protein
MACQWRVFWISGKLFWRNIMEAVSSKKRLSAEASQESEFMEDPAPAHELVKTWMWMPGLLITLFLGYLVMKLQYGMPLRETALALLMAFMFSFLAVQATGATGKFCLVERK